MLLHQRGDRELFQALSRRNLTSSHLCQAILAQSQANLRDRVLQNVLIFVSLMMLGNFRIDKEMLVGHDNFTIKIFLLFLPALSFFGGHTVARLKDSLEVALVRKC